MLLSILLILKLVIVSFNISLVDYEYVLNELLSLEDGKAVDLDGLPPKLLRIADPVIAASLLHLSQGSSTCRLHQEFFGRMENSKICSDS